MRRDGLLGLPATLSACALVVLALAGCGRREDAPKPEPAVQSGTTAPAPAPDPTVGPLASIASGETWNATQIDWQPYEAGLAKAKAENKPVCLVLFTGWCPHCRNYSHVFDDAKVVEEAKRFVMIRINADDRHDVASKYQPDGGYVPRTFFLSPDGQLAADIHAPRPKFQYFFDERNPASLLAGMGEAIRKLAR
ncbi:MAG: thioredoxin family protein [Minicystis sp.]